MTSRADGHARIALMTDWFLPRLGGIEYHVADLARVLQARGCSVRVVTTTPGPAQVDDISVERLRVVRFPIGGFAVSPMLVQRLRTALTEGAYDIVHAHVSVVSPLGFGAVVAARSLGLPTVVTFHSMLFRAVHVLRGLDRLLGWSRWPIVVSAVSRTVAEQARHSAGALDVVVLPNGVDPARWRVSPGAGREPRDEIVAVSAMRLHRKKRPLPLLRAFRVAQRESAARGRRLVLRIAGDGPERGRLERYIVRHRLAGDVSLLGHQPRAALARLYAESDIFVLPSRRESFGIAALEARCAGLPVIALRGGTADFLSTENAVLVDDDAALARALSRLCLDDALRRSLAAADSTLERFSWRSVADAHLAQYARATSLAALRKPAHAPETDALRG